MSAEDYIRKEFNLISRKLPESVPEIEHWRTLMDKHQTLDKIFSSIVIPMVGTYNSNLFSLIKIILKSILKNLRKNAEIYITHFNKSKPACSVEIVLLLLPVADNKGRTINTTNLDERLKAMQKI